MKYKRLHSKRDWLNPKGHWDTGAISSLVAIDEGGIDGEVAIWDCSRKVTISLSAYSEAAVKQRAKKLDIMIDHLQKVKAAMGKAYELTATKGEFSE